MYQTYNRGFIEVVCGPMFAGKTEELIRRLKRLEYANQIGRASCRERV